LIIAEQNQKREAVNHPTINESGPNAPTKKEAGEAWQAIGEKTNYAFWGDPPQTGPIRPGIDDEEGGGH